MTPRITLEFFPKIDTDAVECEYAMLDADTRDLCERLATAAVVEIKANLGSGRDVEGNAFAPLAQSTVQRREREVPERVRGSSGKLRRIGKRKLRTGRFAERFEGRRPDDVTTPMHESGTLADSVRDFFTLEGSDVCAVIKSGNDGHGDRMKASLRADLGGVPPGVDSTAEAAMERWLEEALS